VAKVNNISLVCAAGGAVVSSEGHILMMLRRGAWDLPKGHVEAGETLEECAAREVCEECGLDPALLAVGEELAVTHHSYIIADGTTETKRTAWFRMSYTGDEAAIRPQTEEDITALEWLPPAEAARRAEASFDTIREVIEKLIISEYDN